MKRLLFLTVLLQLSARAAAPDATAEPAGPGYRSFTGPRLGLTLITGETADKLRKDFEAGPWISQFGWQWETRFMTVEGGVTGVTEFVLLAGGMEQGVFLPSLSMLIGLRGPGGLEFGLGPNLSLAGAGYVLALGATKTSGKLNFPVNLSAALGRKGARISLLFGFNAAG
jgi:hypothetical protein